MSLQQVYPCFPACVRGQPTAIKTDPKRSKLVYALGSTVVIRDAVPQDGKPIGVQMYTGHSYRCPRTRAPRADSPYSSRSR